ncbi:MAG: hypothetical protein JNL74_09435, partial [Fibrobacteres bacterium]|nr:hypothetical protein [Fibrobacterota bacterium]
MKVYITLFLLGLSVLIKAEDAELDYGFIQENGSVTARSMAMGGSSTAAGWDYEAAVANPACLTQIRSKEMHLTWGYRSIIDSAWDGNGGNGANGVSENKIKSIGYIYSFPVIRGSLVAAVGYSRPNDLLYIKSLSNNSGWEEMQSEGHTGQWTAALGVDVAKNLGIGFTYSHIRGYEDFSRRDVNVELNANDSYTGHTFSAGWLYRMHYDLYFGGSVRFADYISLTNRMSEDSLKDSYYYPYQFPDENGTFIVPLRLKCALAYVTTPLTLSLDFGFSSWSGLDYTFEEQSVSNFQKVFKDQFNGSFGIEWLLPVVPVKVRAGTSY